jgi:hypothetical protein
MLPCKVRKGPRVDYHSIDNAWLLNELGCLCIDMFTSIDANEWLDWIVNCLTNVLCECKRVIIVYVIT